MMTHDELLDKIKNNTELEDCWMALQKVVELHKPKGELDWAECVVCDVAYPCETIQAIEKELN